MWESSGAEWPSVAAVLRAQGGRRPVGLRILRRGAVVHVSDMTVAEGGPADVWDFLSMFHDDSSWLVPVPPVDLYAALEREERLPLVDQVLRHVRAGQTRICRDLLSRVTGGSVLTGEAPEFAPPAGEPELYLHHLVTRRRFRPLIIAALVADARPRPPAAVRGCSGRTAGPGRTAAWCASTRNTASQRPSSSTSCGRTGRPGRGVRGRLRGLRRRVGCRVRGSRGGRRRGGRPGRGRAIGGGGRRRGRGGRRLSRCGGPGRGRGGQGR